MLEKAAVDVQGRPASELDSTVITSIYLQGWPPNLSPLLHLPDLGKKTLIMHQGLSFVVYTGKTTIDFPL